MKKITISDILTKSEREHFIKSNFHKNGLEVMIEYPSIFESAKVLRDFIIDMADFFQFKDMWKSRLTIIADELNNNAIEYGSLKNDINKMIIKTTIKGNKVDVTLEIEDTGKGKEAKSADEMNLIKINKNNSNHSFNKSIRGRGLFLIITKLVDKLYFIDSKNGGLIVGITKSIEIEK